MRRIAIILLALGVFAIAAGILHWSTVKKHAPIVTVASDEGDPDVLGATRSAVMAVSAGVVLCAISVHLFRLAHWRKKSVLRHLAEKENWLHQRQNLSQADQLQVDLDMQVLDALRKENDDESIARRVDHWVYFPSLSSAEQFCDWAKSVGYTVLSNHPKAGTHCVSLSHVGTVRLQDITAHTLPLHRKAAALDGNYDGWETVVCKALV